MREAGLDGADRRIRVNKALYIIVPLVVCALLGAGAGYLLGDAGMREEYMRNAAKKNRTS